jgi:NTP pyrophosphatase (non-canonical NTP hydrolase)
MLTYKDIAETLEEKNGDLAALWQTIILGEEAGEAQAAFRKWLGQGRELKSEAQFAEELADVIITANVLAVLTNIDLDEVVDRKLDKIETRGGL